jgi:hypothetical protein
MKKVKLKPEVLEQIRSSKYYSSSVGFPIYHNGYPVYVTKDFDIPYFEIIDSTINNNYYKIIEPDKLGKWGLLKDLTEPYEPFEITIDDGIFDM